MSEEMRNTFNTQSLAFEDRKGRKSKFQNSQKDRKGRNVSKSRHAEIRGSFERMTTLPETEKATNNNHSVKITTNSRRPKETDLHPTRNAFCAWFEDRPDVESDCELQSDCEHGTQVAPLKIYLWCDHYSSRFCNE